MIKQVIYSPFKKVSKYQNIKQKFLSFSPRSNNYKVESKLAEHSRFLSQFLM